MAERSSDVLENPPKSEPSVQSPSKNWMICTIILSVVCLLLSGLLIHIVSAPSCNATDYDNVTRHLKKCKLDIADMESTVSQLKLDSSRQKENIINLEKTKKELESDKSELQKANKGLETNISSIESTVSQLKLDSSRQKENIINLEKTKKELESDKSKLQKANKGLETNISEMESTVSQVKLDSSRQKENIINLEKTKKELESDKSELQKANKGLETNISEMESTVSQVKLDSSRQKENIINLEKTKKELESDKSELQKANKGLETDISDMENENKNMTIRLSIALAADASKENEFVTKLGEYSPQKLAEQFTETYDNEYTEAFMELQENDNDMDTETTVRIFLNILKLAYDESTNYAEKHLDSILQSITTLKVEFSNNHEKQKYSQKESSAIDEEKSKKTFDVSANHSFSDVEWKQLFDIRKASAYKMQKPLIQVLTDAIVMKYKIKADSQPQMMKYLQKCLSLCWIMNQNQKPIYMNFKEPEVFDTDVYRSFLTSGKHVRYVVWPPLYLNKDGLMLAKGIAEGKD